MDLLEWGRRMKKSTTLLCLFGLVAVAPAQSQMVLTPSGYRDRATIHVLKSGQSVQKRAGRYEIIESTTHAVAQQIIPKLANSPGVNDSGWITDAVWQVPNDDSILSFSASWKVPPPPVQQDGQLLYVFNALTEAEGAILQPVLQWGAAPIGGGNYWAVASWYVTSDGEAFTTQPIQVQPGQVLTGVITRFVQPSGEPDNYTAQFVGIEGTLLTTISVADLTNAYEALEVYSVDSCTDYPTGATAFSGIELQTANGNPSIAWTAENKVSDCGQHANVVGAGEVELVYGN